MIDSQSDKLREKMHQSRRSKKQQEVETKIIGAIASYSQSICSKNAILTTYLSILATNLAILTTYLSILATNLAILDSGTTPKWRSRITPFGSKKTV